jgi:hypothetical protein
VDVVNEENATGNADEALALTVNGAAPRFFPLSVAKLMV